MTILISIVVIVLASPWIILAIGAFCGETERG